MSTENRARSAQIKFWVTPAVKKEIQERARSAKSIGEYLESVALAKPARPAIERAELVFALDALGAINDAMRPASMIEIRRAVFELKRLGNLQKHLYSEAKVPIDRIDAVAFDLREAIPRVEEALHAAIASDRAAEHLTAAILRKLETDRWTGIKPPDPGFAATILVRLDATIEAICDAFGVQRR